MSLLQKSPIKVTIYSAKEPSNCKEPTNRSHPIDVVAALIGIDCKAIFVEYRALFIEYRALFTEYRALCKWELMQIVQAP